MAAPDENPQSPDNTPPRDVADRYVPSSTGPSPAPIVVGWIAFWALLLGGPVIAIMAGASSSDSTSGFVLLFIFNVYCGAWLAARIVGLQHKVAFGFSLVGFTLAVAVLQCAIAFAGCLVFLRNANFGH